MNVRSILLTTDLSDASNQACEPAVTLAKQFGAKIHVLYVGEDRIPPMYGDFAGAQIQSILEAHEEMANRELAAIAEKLSDNVKVETHYSVGIPHAEIVRIAEEHEVDLIVMATHGRGFVGHALLGSTTERVIRHAPCPVLAIRETR